jgi:hypothetical protein
MIFAPHILLKKSSVLESDEYGQPIDFTESDWETMCSCRCDNKVTDWLKSENGEAYQTRYHVVCNDKVGIKAGDYVRCIEGDRVRAEGEVYMVKECNYFKYTEIYL